MDDFQARTLKILRERHEEKIRRDAVHIQEYIGYVLHRLERDTNGRSASHLVVDIAAAAQDILARTAALEAMEDTIGILQTTDETVTGKR